jgi:hypothetical protein
VSHSVTELSVVADQVEHTDHVQVLLLLRGIHLGFGAVVVRDQPPTFLEKAAKDRHHPDRLHAHQRTEVEL